MAAAAAAAGRARAAREPPNRLRARRSRQFCPPLSVPCLLLPPPRVTSRAPPSSTPRRENPTDSGRSEAGKGGVGGWCRAWLPRHVTGLAVKGRADRLRGPRHVRVESGRPLAAAGGSRGGAVAPPPSARRSESCPARAFLPACLPLLSGGGGGGGHRAGPLHGDRASLPPRLRAPLPASVRGMVGRVAVAAAAASLPGKDGDAQVGTRRRAGGGRAVRAEMRRGGWRRCWRGGLGGRRPFIVGA